MTKFNPVFSLAGRVMIASIFILSGFAKISAIEGTQGYMEAMGLPGILVYPTILFEIAAGLAIIAGYRTRYMALAQSSAITSTWTSNSTSSRSR